jgi:hypothetical protein
VLERFLDEAKRITAGQLVSCFLISLVYTTITCALEGSAPTSEQWLDWFWSTEIMFALVWTGIITTALAAYLENMAMEADLAASTGLGIRNSSCSVSLEITSFPFAALVVTMLTSNMMGFLLQCIGIYEFVYMRKL